ncbi:hypothetical protein JCM19237_2226 [Photobacterium aphoticum]|uniref:Uncharacterized protein n=1 Tax=Photobacterium aphoticum TaxID=754436 RepID=A0A090QLS7_9GAMM|nr:hypothetical protein JCM19237_2226 [Photobacterium aphoticum]
MNFFERASEQGTDNLARVLKSRAQCSEIAVDKKASNINETCKKN